MDYGFNSHRRLTKSGISGLTLGKGTPVVLTDPVHIQENRVDGVLRSVTVLSDGTASAKAVVRLDGPSARY